MATVSRGTWALSLLQSLEVPTTNSNLQIVVGWETAEGGAGPQFNIAGNLAAFNPLNTKQPMADPASKDSGGGIQAYNSWSQGLQATVITLNNGDYTGILNMLQRGDASPLKAATAIRSSPWGTAKDHTVSWLESLISNTAVTSGGLIIPAVKAGGVAGLGGTGTPANSTQVSPWIVGDSTNPDQDYWTTGNQYAQEGQLYFFSDGETLYLADGNELMAQTPALVVHRRDPRVISLNLTYDNTSFIYANTHIVKIGVQRRATLSRMTSPTQATLKLVCAFDSIRGGQVIYLLGAGTLGGLWLVGDSTRSEFEAVSTLTLVKGAMPLSALTGETIGPNISPAKIASKPGSGTVIWAMLAYATKLNADNYKYVWGGGHARAGTASIGEPGNGYNGVTKGFDCSGAVGAVLAAAGVGITWGASFGDNDTVISTLLATGDLRSGQGTGPVEVTLFNKPGIHIFMRLNGSFWGTEDGSGDKPSNQYGVGWIKDGQVPPTSAGFTAYHIKPNVLRGYITGSNASTAATGGGL